MDNVKGVNLNFEIYDNTTEAIAETAAFMRSIIPAFSSYQIAVQINYAFIERYGVQINGIWVFNDTTCFSDEFFVALWNAIAPIYYEYRNVVLHVGFNEPFEHFGKAEDALAVIQREYTTFKAVINWVPYSCEIHLPSSVNFDSIKLIWQDYSDYIGLNLWVDAVVPSLGGAAANQTATLKAQEIVGLAKEYSLRYNKPIFIGELPAWYQDRFNWIVAQVCDSPKNILCVYELWTHNWPEIPRDYALFLVGDDGTVIDNEETLSVYNSAYKSTLLNEFRPIILAIVGLAIVSICVGYIKNNI
ncbi:MAG: hypothetical protein QXD70_05155 [Candidatus Bathyarchaeia archaeon]